MPNNVSPYLSFPHSSLLIHNLHPSSTEIYDLELSTCSMSSSGSSAYLSIQITGTTGQCQSLNFNKLSLSRDQVIPFHIDCAGPDLGIIVSIRLRAGAGDQLCLKRVRILSAVDKKLVFFATEFKSLLWMKNDNKWTP